MKVKEFAEKHLGQRIQNTREGAKSQFGVISGYTTGENNFVIYEPETPDVGYRANKEDDKTHHFLRAIKKYLCFPLSKVGNGITLLVGPDDCDTCGARGIDPCKDWCPNKI